MKQYEELLKNKKIIAISVLIIIIIFVLATQNYGKKDDWQFTPSIFSDGGLIAGIIILLVIIGIIGGIILVVKGKMKGLILIIVGAGILVVIGAIVIVILTGLAGNSSVGNQSMYSSSYDQLGFSVGGAKDVGNFRKNIENNYLPLLTDITYEGLFYEYYFDTGKTETCEKLFCPSYTYAVSKDPFSQEKEYYLSVGLNSNIKKSDFQRKKLNLIVVLDISGSMSSSFNSYYYDQFGNKTENELDEEEDLDKTKMQIANESVVALIDHLNDDDRFGMVLFDNTGYIGKPLSKVGDTDMQAIKGHILELRPQGGTNFEAGYKQGTELFEEVLNADQSEYENRIIFLTDAQPNIGILNKEGLLGMTQTNADKKIHTTFIGIGVDFGTELIEAITKIRGSNYYSVHSAKEFKTRMDDEFEYMVTPLVFNLLLNLDAQGYEIEKVYGSPEANEATGQIMKVNTLFPSERKETETKGGIVLLKLKKLSEAASLKLSVSYEDRIGNQDKDEKSIHIEKKEEEYYENNGIRKGILLSRYASLIKHWINDERKNHEAQFYTPTITAESGLTVPEEPGEIKLGIWERQSIPLKISEEYKQLFSEFKQYFETEMNQIEDNTLSKEIEILEKLINHQ